MGLESITYIVLNSITTSLEELTFPVYKLNFSKNFCPIVWRRKNRRALGVA